MAASFETLIVKSPAFEQNGFIPKKFTGRGEDISPKLCLEKLAPEAKSIAIVMNDLDHPIRDYNHWIIWNIPVQETIPENIPHGEKVQSLGGAVQGIGYGKHQYRGPKPPFFMKKPHRYQFHVYVLDCMLTLESNARKAALMKCIEGHMIQYGSIKGQYKNG